MSLTESQINTALAEYQAARTAVLVGGQSYSFNTGGTVRTVTQADLPTIEKQIASYCSMLDELNGKKGFQVQAGW